MRSNYTLCFSKIKFIFSSHPHTSLPNKFLHCKEFVPRQAATPPTYHTNTNNNVRQDAPTSTLYDSLCLLFFSPPFCPHIFLCILSTKNVNNRTKISRFNDVLVGNTWEDSAVRNLWKRRRDTAKRVRDKLPHEGLPIAWSSPMIYFSSVGLRPKSGPGFFIL
jgi:hypothetical protein